MKKEATKKVTIEDLATTIDNLAIMTSKGFDSVHREIGEVNGRLGKVEERLENVEESIHSVRGEILSLSDRTVPRFEFERLITRVDRLERKTKV